VFYYIPKYGNLTDCAIGINIGRGNDFTGSIIRKAASPLFDIAVSNDI